MEAATPPTMTFEQLQKLFGGGLQAPPAAAPAPAAAAAAPAPAAAAPTTVTVRISEDQLQELASGWAHEARRNAPLGVQCFRKYCDAVDKASPESAFGRIFVHVLVAGVLTLVILEVVGAVAGVPGIRPSSIGIDRSSPVGLLPQ